MEMLAVESAGGIPSTTFLGQDMNYNYKLQVCSKLLKNQPTGLCFHLFVLIQTCTYLYSVTSLHNGD